MWDASRLGLDCKFIVTGTRRIWATMALLWRVGGRFARAYIITYAGWAIAHELGILTRMRQEWRTSRLSAAPLAPSPPPGSLAHGSQEQ